MRNHLSRSCYAIFACLVFLNGAFAAEELVNGGFDSEPNFGAGNAGNDGSYSGMTGSQVPGWTIVPGHALTIHNTLSYPYITAPYSANLDGEGFGGTNADIYQDFASSAANSYALSFKYQGWFSSTATFNVQVFDTITNGVLYSVTEPWTSALITDGGSFLGTGNPLRLEVKEFGFGTNDNAFTVDDFSVVSTPVPEPTTFVLLGCASCFGIWQFAKRRRAD